MSEIETQLRNFCNEEIETAKTELKDCHKRGHHNSYAAGDYQGTIDALKCVMRILDGKEPYE